MTDWIRLCPGGDCPEYRYVGGRVEIRDSARPAEVAWFRQDAWEKFVEALRSGDSLADTLLSPAVASGPENPAAATTAPANAPHGTHGAPA